MSGNQVASGGVLLTLTQPDDAPFRVYFDGDDIFASHSGAPFVLSSIEILDGTAGFVVSDRLTDPITIDGHDWRDFGPRVPQGFVRGDSNGSGLPVDISDAIAILDYAFTGLQELGCMDAADADSSGEIDISDAVYVIGFLFLGGPAMPAPYPDCGSLERLGCVVYPPCE
jgi:hypothetical protein